MTMSPRDVGAIAAIAGRSIPGNVLTTILASASSAPVFPAETNPAASPLATASIASRIDEVRIRSAAVGFISGATTVAAWRSVHDCITRFRSAIIGRSVASSPINRKRASGCRSAASSIPSSTMSGA